MYTGDYKAKADSETNANANANVAYLEGERRRAKGESTPKE